MKTSMMLAIVGSFAAGAGVALTAAEGLASPAPARAPSVYTDGQYGFSITPPAFPKGAKDTGGLAASFQAPAKNGFASNINIMIQNVSMTADQYCELSTGQFKQMEFKVLSESRKKVSGRDAIAWEYEGEMQGRVLRWSSLAVVEKDRVFLVTGTALKADYEAVGKEFKASLESFKFAD